MKNSESFQFPNKVSCQKATNGNAEVIIDGELAITVHRCSNDIFNQRVRLAANAFELLRMAKEIGFEYVNGCPHRDVDSSKLLKAKELYNAITQPPRETHRPFANADEFKTYSLQLVKRKNDNVFFRCMCFDDNRIFFNLALGMSYEKAFEEFEFADGKPFGFPID